MFKLLLEGGPFMFATLGLSVITTAIFLWRAYFFWLGRKASGRTLLTEVMSAIESHNIKTAIRLCSNDTSSLAKLLKAALMRANRTEKEIRRAVEAAALEEIPKMRAGTVYLPQLSNLATLFGLIGTIHGLIIAFQGAGSESLATRQTFLSQGIAIAFYNTFFGLIVATASIVFYLLLLSKMNGTLSFLEHAAASSVDSILWHRERSSRAA